MIPCVYTSNLLICLTISILWKIASYKPGDLMTCTSNIQHSINFHPLKWALGKQYFNTINLALVLCFQICGFRPDYLAVYHISKCWLIQRFFEELFVYTLVACNSFRFCRNPLMSSTSDCLCFCGDRGLCFLNTNNWPCTLKQEHKLFILLQVVYKTTKYFTISKIWFRHVWAYLKLPVFSTLN